MSLDISLIAEQEISYVTKANSLIQVNRYIGADAGKSLTLLEAKLIAYCLSVLDTNTNCLLPVEFTIPDFWKACGISPRGQKYYTMVAESLQSIRNRSAWMLKINAKTKRKEAVLVSWVLKTKIKDDKKTCVLEFDPDLAPALLALRSNYTKYPRSAVLSLQSKYGFYLYELLCSYEKQGSEIRIELSKLAELLDATQWTKPSDLLRKVIIPAVNDINACTANDLHVEVETEQTGKKTTHILFRAFRITGKCLSEGETKTEQEAEHPNMRSIKEQINYDSVYADMISGQISEDLQTLALILTVMEEVLYAPKQLYSINKSRIGGRKVQEQFKKLGEREIRYVLESISNISEPIRHPQSYLRAMLHNAPLTVDVYEQSKLTSAERKKKQQKERYPTGASGELGPAEIEAIERIMREDSPFPEMPAMSWEQE